MTLSHSSDNAPAFVLADWKDATQDNQVRASYAYFAVPIYYGVQPPSDSRTGNNPDANVNNANNSPTQGNGKPRDITGLNDNTARTTSDNVVTTVTSSDTSRQQSGSVPEAE